jgi:hypothetical protein
MTWGYRSWFQDFINVWTMLATVLKNKVMYRQFVQCHFYKLKMFCTFKTFLPLLSGHASYFSQNTDHPDRSSFWRVIVLYFGCIGVPRQKSVTHSESEPYRMSSYIAMATAIWRPKHQHGRRKSAHTLLWQQQYKQQHGRYGISDLLDIADAASHEH